MGRNFKRCKKEVGIIHANIDLDEVRKVRRAIPSLIQKIIQPISKFFFLLILIILLYSELSVL